MLRLKSKTINTRIIQAPMAGCTNLPFRLISREKGLKFAFTEMISSEALVRKSKKTFDLLKRTLKDKPLGTQLFGHNPGTMADASEIIEESGFDLLDLNFGCPVRKITRSGAGAYLLKDYKTGKKIMSAVTEKIKKIPVSIKMRLGYSDNSAKEAIRIAKIAEDSGISMITVHGRTKAQGYSGKSDWEAIGRIKKSVKIPVWGNGNIFSGEDAKKIFEISNCDGIMIGRGSLGNPWIFRNIELALRPRSPIFPNLEEIKLTAIKHIKLQVKYEGERTGVLTSRKIAGWYFRGEPGAATLRKKINISTSIKEMTVLINKF